MEMIQLNKTQRLLDFWQDVASQNADKLQSYFSPDAVIKWHNTNELFSVQQYIRANCEYPGDWSGEVEKVVLTETVAITVTRVWLSDHSKSFHAVSFFEFLGDKIHTLEEYWGDDEPAPPWRLAKNIGKPIQEHLSLP